jgi:hypothetical protein
MGDPVVVTISEPGDKLFTSDAETLRRLGIRIDLRRVLPDAVIADFAENPVAFWVVEAVAPTARSPRTPGQAAEVGRGAEHPLQRVPVSKCVRVSSRRGGPPAAEGPGIGNLRLVRRRASPRAGVVRAGVMLSLHRSHQRAS